MEPSPPSQQEILGRVEKLQERIQERNLDAAFILQNADLFYFTGTVQDGLLAVPATGEPRFFVRRSVERARATSVLPGIVPYRSFSDLPDLFKKEGLGTPQRIGLEMDVLPVLFLHRLERAFPGAWFSDLSLAVRQIRMQKSAYEVEQMRRAADLAERMVQAVPRLARVGMSEMELEGAVYAVARAAGHHGPIRRRTFKQEGFVGMLLSGERALVPSFLDAPTPGSGPGPAIGYGAGFRKLTRGDILLVDMVGHWNGYLADQTRTLCLEEIDADLAETYNVAVEILVECSHALRPGIAAGEIYAIGERIAIRHGLREGYMNYGSAQVAYIGHGVGIEIDEMPFLLRGDTTPLAVGMTLAVEPKLAIPGRGVVGVEDTFLVTGAGGERITYSDRTLKLVKG
ncbi:MAG: M24 family metallopeptidase [Candidatus Methylomirabilales bacterium]